MCIVSGIAETNQKPSAPTDSHGSGHFHSPLFLLAPILPYFSLDPGLTWSRVKTDDHRRQLRPNGWSGAAILAVVDCGYWLVDMGIRSNGVDGFVPDDDDN